MKHFLLNTVLLLTLSLLTGCSKSQTELTTFDSTIASTASDITKVFPAETEGNVKPENDDTSYYTNEVYSLQIDRYYTALSQQWNEDVYWDNEMSAMTVYYYEGTPMKNVGYTFMDLDGNGIQELIIGAILGAQRDPLVFEIWTLKDDAPVILAQSGSHNRYYLQYTEEDDLWTVAYEAENGAANHAVYYLQLIEGDFSVVQGVVFDALANENEPWFMAYDLDWDVSNDTPIDESTANSVMNAGRNTYAAQEYIPYSRYK